MTDSTFCYTRIAATGRNWNSAYDHLTAAAAAPLTKAEIGIWGIWSGLFGIGSNELVLVTHAPRRGNHASLLNAALERAPARIVDQWVLEPTVRPTTLRAIERPGLYVFRFFDVRHADVDRIAQLSFEAWTTFEASTAYHAEPLGLFREYAPRGERGVMLLCTWYDGFASWQTSRTPAPEAVENFRKRHALTAGTIAYATRLIERNVARDNRTL